VKKANFAWFPVHRVYAKVGIFVAQCALSTLPVWIDLTSPEGPGLSLFTDWCMVCHPEDRSIQHFDLCTDLMNTLLMNLKVQTRWFKLLSNHQ